MPAQLHYRKYYDTPFDFTLFFDTFTCFSISLLRPRRPAFFSVKDIDVNALMTGTVLSPCGVDPFDDLPAPLPIRDGDPRREETVVRVPLTGLATRFLLGLASLECRVDLADGILELVVLPPGLLPEPSRRDRPGEPERETGWDAATF